MKPEKKVVEQLQSIHMGYTQGERVANARGYNQGLDAREKWLKEFMPSENELAGIICHSIGMWHLKVLGEVEEELVIARAISKRLRGEK